LQFHKWDGHYWSFPLFEFGYLFFYRKDILSNAGYSKAPVTWDDVYSAGEKINDPDNDLYAIGLDYSAGNTARQMYYCVVPACDGRELDAQGRVAVNIPENADALEIYTGFYKKGLVPKGAAGVSQYTMNATPLDKWFEAGKIAMTIRGSLQAVMWEDNNPDFWNKVGLAVNPYGPPGHTGTYAQPGVLYAFKECDYPQLGKEFIRFFARSENTRKWTNAVKYPIYNNLEYDFSNKEWYKKTLEVLEYGAREGYPTVHPLNAKSGESFWPALMVQDVIYEDISIDEALQKYQKEVEEIYNEPASPMVK
jgi:ABC-type glycerol-3-phosphate transport system substrate-binding protein